MICIKEYIYNINWYNKSIILEMIEFSYNFIKLGINWEIGVLY